MRSLVPKLAYSAVAYGSDQAFWIVRFAAGGLTRDELKRQPTSGIARISGLEPPSTTTTTTGGGTTTTAPPKPKPVVPNTVLGKGPKVPKAAFASCRSPWVLKLAPGKYRFAVRAVADGVIDASSAESAFTVVHKAKHPRHR